MSTLNLKPAILIHPRTKEKYVFLTNGSFEEERWGLILPKNDQPGEKSAEKRRFRERLLELLRKKLVGKFMKLPTSKTKLGLVVDIKDFDQKQRLMAPFYSFIITLLVKEEIYKVCWHRTSMELINEIENTKKELGIP